MGTPRRSDDGLTAVEVAVLAWLAVATILGATSALAWLAIALSGGRP